MTYTTVAQNNIPSEFWEQCTSLICPEYLPLKNPVGKNRRYDIYPYIDIASLKTFIWETPRGKLIKRKECNMIPNRLNQEDTLPEPCKCQNHHVPI